jgi:hypothetical protein
MVYAGFSRLGKVCWSIVCVVLVLLIDMPGSGAADRPPLPAKQTISQLPRLPFYSSLQVYNTVCYVVLGDDENSTKIFNKLYDFVLGQKKIELENTQSQFAAARKGATSSTQSSVDVNLVARKDRLEKEIAAFENHTQKDVVQENKASDFITFMDDINAEKTAVILVACGAKGYEVSQVLEKLKDKRNCLHSVVLFDPDVFSRSYFGGATLYHFNLSCIKHRLYNFYSKQKTSAYRKVESGFDEANQWLKAVNICCFDLKDSYQTMLIPDDVVIGRVVNTMTFIDKHYVLNIDLSAVFIREKNYASVFINRALRYDNNQLTHVYAEGNYVWHYPVPFDELYITKILNDEELLSYNEILSLPDKTGRDDIVKYKKAFSDAQSKIQESPDIAALIKTYEGIYDFIYKDQSKAEAWGIWLAGKALNIPWLGDYIKRIVTDKVKTAFTKSVAADTILNSFINKFKEQPDKLEIYKRNLNRAILGIRLRVYSSTQEDRVCELLNWVLNNQDYIPYFFAFEMLTQDVRIFLRQLGATDDLANQFKIKMTPDDTSRARVRMGKGICDGEKEIVFDRARDISVPALNEICSQYSVPFITVEDAPKIGIACSGGGYRAMIAALGFVHGLDETRILPAVNYMTALSGSSWMLFPWIACQMQKGDETFTDFVTRFRNNAQYFNAPFTPKEMGDIASILLTRYINEGGITLVDFYGALLARALLKESNDPNDPADFPDSGQTVSLSWLRDTGLLKNYPFPIATAIGSMYEQSLGFEVIEKEYEKGKRRNYYWFEISPLEIGCEYLNAWIDPRFSGCRFNNRVVEKVGPEVPLGAFMGISGSAFAADIRVILSKLGGKIPSYLESFVQNLIIKRGGDWMKFTQKDQYPLGLEAPDIKDFRFASGRLLNFARGMKKIVKPTSVPFPSTHFTEESFINLEEFINLFDSGIDFNLPVDPLLRRGVNLYLICDASANVEHQLAKVQQYVAELDKGYKLPPMKLDTVAKDEVSVFYDAKDVFCPVIVYVPNMVGMSTLQFNYDEGDFNKIYKTMKATVERNYKIIVDAINLATLNSKLQRNSNDEKLKQLRSSIVNKLSGTTVTSHGAIDIKDEYK